MDKVAAKYGYSWKPYEVETEDGWFLTVMRITAVDGVELSKSEEMADKPPVFLQHGGLQSGFSWMGEGILGPSLPGALAERGYDVWVGNSRGTKYSNVNRKDAEGWTLKEHWDFDWSDFGNYDIPAVVETILEETGKPKVTLIGYSQGSA